MRQMSQGLVDALKRRIQTDGTRYPIHSSFILSRPTTPLIDDDFFEEIPAWKNGVTDCDITVCHPLTEKDNLFVDIILVQNGRAKWMRSVNKHSIQQFQWVDMGFDESAKCVSICYDSKTVETNGINWGVENKTDLTPWLYWVTPEGALWTQHGSDESTRTPITNMLTTDVSTVRGMQYDNKDFDYGMITFFVTNEQLYYIQMINGTWYNPLFIDFGPPGTKWREITSSRTWDYRVIVEAKASDGRIYEMVTRMQGFGKFGEENLANIDIRGAKLSMDVTGMRETDTSLADNLVKIDSKPAKMFSKGGLFTAGTPDIISVENVRDANGDYGRIVKIGISPFKGPHRDTWATNQSSFQLVDSRGRIYVCTETIVNYEDTSDITLIFSNFNSARGACTLRYVPGTFTDAFGTPFTEFSKIFTPVGLVPPIELPPKPISVTNSSDGLRVDILFDGPVTSSNPISNASKFSVSADITLVGLFDGIESRPVNTVEINNDTVTLVFEEGNRKSIINFNDVETTISYAGGDLSGGADVVESFEIVFIPTDMKPKNNQVSELSLSLGVDNTKISTSLRPIVNQSCNSGDENLVNINLVDAIIYTKRTNISDL